MPSYFLGEVGILLVHWRNISNPTNEALWGAPGTMVGALHMHGWTNESRWRELFLENVEKLWRTWLPDESARCHIWTQDLYGRTVQYIGAGHGFAVPRRLVTGNGQASGQGRCHGMERARSFAMHAIDSPPCKVNGAAFRVEGVITPSRIEQVEHLLSGVRKELSL